MSWALDFLGGYGSTWKGEDVKSSPGFPRGGEISISWSSWEATGEAINKLLSKNVESLGDGAGISSVPNGRSQVQSRKRTMTHVSVIRVLRARREKWVEEGFRAIYSFLCVSKVTLLHQPQRYF
jgi:hypothetical protein